MNTKSGLISMQVRAISLYNSLKRTFSSFAEHREQRESHNLARLSVVPKVMASIAGAHRSKVWKLFRNHSRAAGWLTQRGWSPSRVTAGPFHSAGSTCCAYLESCGSHNSM